MLESEVVKTKRCKLIMIRFESKFGEINSLERHLWTKSSMDSITKIKNKRNSIAVEGNRGVSTVNC